jgi:hypothetical protein
MKFYEKEDILLRSPDGTRLERYWPTLGRRALARRGRHDAHPWEQSHRVAADCEERRRGAVITHRVDLSAVTFFPCDLALWLLFYLESHGATVVLHDDRHVSADLNPIPGMTDLIAGRWAPIVIGLTPELRACLKARPRC